MKKLAIVMGCLLLNACAIRGPSLEIKPPQVEIDGVHSSGGHGKHCPPGQAKKGRC
ncbi:hypothetical protein [Gallaecimonas sp. GXIMD4217]|uniref:hypothetical protein n=1 Tax=Gallaecimonas sp. GXIMD4217 TaxID=3131927 RepID=UPI00311ACC79